MIKFLLNETPVEIADGDPNLTVLDYLRTHKNLCGSKEGCASGDCGACTVVLASPNSNAAADNPLEYNAVNSCITFIGALHGRQLLTVEHLAHQDQLHPVQQAMVDCHGSQCGFCTPGFVMSMFALYKNPAYSKPLNNTPPNNKPDSKSSDNADNNKVSSAADHHHHAIIEEALSGNLCRCTGYRPIIEATQMACNNPVDDQFSQHQQSVARQLAAITQTASLSDKATGNDTFYAPTTVEQLAERLARQPHARLSAGSTDLALEVTQQLRPVTPLIYLGRVAELLAIQEAPQQFRIGAAVSYSQCYATVRNAYPAFADMLLRLGSRQIRNQGTLGGNIGNASPIGDTPPVLIALRSHIVLASQRANREIPLEDYFHGYKQTDLQPGEFIRDILLPKPLPGYRLMVYKISKRFDDDISAILMAIWVHYDGDTVADIVIACGGMAATPKRAIHCEQALLNNPLNDETIAAAQRALDKDFQPIDDVRASAHYRLQVAKNLLTRLHLELTEPDEQTQLNRHA